MTAFNFAYCSFYGALLLVAILNGIALANEPDPKDINLLEISFCYEDKELLPFFTGYGHAPPEQMPGASIEVLNKASHDLNSFNFKFVRKPWKRCLQDLQSNKVDALIASYSPERDPIGVYPKQNNKIDSSLAMNALGTCFLVHKDSDFSWDGNAFKSEEAKTLAVPAGYSIIARLKNLPIQIHQTDSAATSLLMLKQKRIDLALTLCSITEQHTYFLDRRYHDLKVLLPPLAVKDGFFVVSQQFYEQNQALTWQIWRYLAKVNAQDIYQKYLEGKIQD